MGDVQVDELALVVFHDFYMVSEEVWGPGKYGTLT